VALFDKTLRVYDMSAQEMPPAQKPEEKK
jgi:hypothetical protein